MIRIISFIKFIFTAFFVWIVIFELRDFMIGISVVEIRSKIKSKESFKRKFDVEIEINSRPKACHDKLDEKTILVVATQFVTRDGFAIREAVRNTWGKARKYKNFLFENIFLMGKGNETDHALDDKLRHEHSLCGDLVIGDFIDTYKNLTFKRLLGTKWIVEHCPNAKFILKIDDEIFPDTQRIFKLIHHVGPQIKNESIGHFGCLAFERNAPVRNPFDKYYVSYKEYPRPFFPDFCLGPASISTREALVAEYSVRHSVPFFWGEDVFFTGLLREYYEIVYNVPIKLLWMAETHYKGTRDAQLTWCKSPSSDKYITNDVFGGIFIEMFRGDSMLSDLYCIFNKTIEIRNFKKPKKIKATRQKLKKTKWFSS